MSLRLAVRYRIPPSPTQIPSPGAAAQVPIQQVAGVLPGVALMVTQEIYLRALRMRRIRRSPRLPLPSLLPHMLASLVTPPPTVAMEDDHVLIAWNAAAGPPLQVQVVVNDMVIQNIPILQSPGSDPTRALYSYVFSPTLGTNYTLRYQQDISNAMTPGHSLDHCYLVQHF